MPADHFPTDPAERRRAQQEAALALQDALADSIRLDLPVLSWTVTHGGVLVGDVRSETPREDFQAWTEHLGVDTEDLSHDGRTVLRGITETGMPGRRRSVRVIVIAKFYEPAQDSHAA